MSFLKPSEIPDISLFKDWEKSLQIKINENIINVEKGKIIQEGITNDKSKKYCDFYRLQSIFSREEVCKIRNLAENIKLNTDPDSVDGMCSHEFYIENPSFHSSGDASGDANGDTSVRVLRNNLKNIIQPVIDEKITPYVRSLYSQHAIENRLCSCCYYFIRKYNENERTTHATHRDGHAYATVVISLSDYEKEYTGGLYVATSERYKKFIELNRGDGIVHKHDLLHGVKVQRNKIKSERWSLILWYKDSTECIDYSNEWYKSKAHKNEPIYQSLYATQNDPDNIVLWHKKAAENGLASSMVKLARAYLKKLPSNLEFNSSEAERLYRLAIDTSQDPNAQYELAEMILLGLVKIQTNSMLYLLSRVINLLEDSAKGGNVFAMFNLGIAHLYGYTGKVDMDLAKDWFEYSDLPEGLFAASLYYQRKQDLFMMNKLRNRAQILGFGTEWRKASRTRTGLGGASGIDINLSWPQMPNGIKPEIF